MDHEDLRHWSKTAADWIADYHAGLRERPVRPDRVPGGLAAALPARAPEAAEAIETIFDDFRALVPEAMTHWQHPRFMAYFPANAAPASMLAEQLANGIAAQAMLWQTAPAATEMEEVIVRWLAAALGLPDHWAGTIHDSATTATICAVLTMRERALGWRGNDEGLADLPPLRIYASDQVHSSVEKAARIAGIGKRGICTIATDDSLSMAPRALEAAIRLDKSNNVRPAGLILSVGGTGTGGSDRIGPLIDVARAHDLYVHVDAAWAGSAMICPEFRPLWQGVEAADSVIFNPHKWLGAQFDCSVQFLADPGPQVRTLGLRPDYLVTPGSGAVTDFNEWTIPLGRRFRALKLWFLLRAHGLEGLRAMIRNHVAWSGEVAEAIAALPGFEIVTPPVLSLFTFRYGADDAATDALLARVNRDGRIYLTQTRHRGRYVIRLQIGQFASTRDDAMMAPLVLSELAAGL